MGIFSYNKARRAFVTEFETEMAREITDYGKADH
jgi:hypothetical protein